MITELWYGVRPSWMWCRLEQVFLQQCQGRNECLSCVSCEPPEQITPGRLSFYACLNLTNSASSDAPTFDQPQNETLEETKRDVYLNCTAKGNPKPVFTWQFPRPVEPLEEQKTKNALTLDRFLQFPGTYKCTASNSEGSAIKYFTIVKAPSKKTTLLFEVSTKSSGSFVCH